MSAQGTREFASAAWEDNETIPEISLDSNIVPGKYTTTISNILSKHCNEIKGITEEITPQITTISKKKLKDLLSKHNNEIFSFLSRPDKTPHTLGIAETIFRRYGHEVPTMKGTNPNAFIRDLNLDASINTTVAEFDENLKKVINFCGGCGSDSDCVVANGNGGLEDYLKQTRWLHNEYRAIGEEVLRLEANLFQKLDVLDKLNNRLPLITSLTPNGALAELVSSFSKYAEEVFKTSNVEDAYKELIETYKKWNICRQIIITNNLFKAETNEPLCSICITEPVGFAIVPCGHTFCGGCAKKQNTTCYICRGNIRERVKLFFT